MRSDEHLIPYHWTAEEAHAVIDFLEQLTEAIWSRYGLFILQDINSRARPPNNVQLELPFDSLWFEGDYLPF
jgi:hypothetical protein